jgi:Uma2 family endonuclease
MGSDPHQRPRATVADLLAIPEEERFHELLDGELVRKAAPSGEHGGAQADLVGSLGPMFGHPPGGGVPGGWWFATEVEIQLAEDVCRPDVVAWRREKAPQRPRGAPVRLVPDWVCEILSTNRRNDLVRKKHIHHRARIAHCWIIDPEQGTLAVNRWHPDGYLEVLAAQSGQLVRAEPFDAIELSVSALSGVGEEDLR